MEVEMFLNLTLCPSFFLFALQLAPSNATKSCKIASTSTGPCTGSSFKISEPDWKALRMGPVASDDRSGKYR